MLIIADYRISAPMQQALSKWGEVVLLHSGDVYESISGHPDIFLCRLPGLVVAAANTPPEVLDALQRHQIRYLLGKYAVEGKYPQTARYCAMVAHGWLIHNLRHTDPVLLRQTLLLNHLHVNQGYAACNLIALPDGSFIGSDEGLVKNMHNRGIEATYINPEGIALPPHRHGFLGGAAGWNQQHLFFTGRPESLPDGNRLISLMQSKGLPWLSLSDEMTDVGGLQFFE